MKVTTEQETEETQKLHTLLACLESIKVDENSMPGSEQSYTSTFDEAEILRIKDKFFKILKEL